MSSDTQMNSISAGKFVQFPELDKCLHVHFKEKAKQIPDKIAVVDGKRKLTYSELDKKTDQLALFIHKKYGVGLDDPIGIYVEKSLEYVISYVAILKAGAAYSPIEMSYPPIMIKRLTGEIPMKVILTKKQYCENLPPSQNYLCFEDWDQEVGVIDPTKESVDNNPDPYNLAYLVFSSGSTGEPKAIACPHIGSLNSYYSRIKEYPYSEDEREGANIFFTWELFRPLLGGVTLYVIPQEIIYDPYRFADFVEENKLTRFLVTPSTLQSIMDVWVEKRDVLKTKFASLRTILLCGEVVHRSLFESFHSLFPDVAFLNLYSVSECHDISCCDLRNFKHSERNISTTGRLMENVISYVVDRETEKILPYGEVGELYVGGITLARAYLGLQGEKLTAGRFPENKYPFPTNTNVKELPAYCKDHRLYKSGDLVKFRPDGTLEILARCNDMVKIRGYSIELPAVESHLNNHPKINSSVVIKDDKERLIGYIVLAPGVNISGLEIREFLSEYVPFYMIPNILMKIDGIPVGSIGKLNKKVLPVPEERPDLKIDLRGGKVEPPKDGMEIRLLRIWKELFPNEDTMGVTDNFYYLGGTSLMMARLFMMIQKEFWKEDEECPIQIQALNSNQTIRAQVELVRKLKKDDQVEEKYTFYEDIELPFEVSPDDLADPLQEDHIRFDPQGEWKILVTGCTGFLGAFLLTSILMKYPRCTVYCLVKKEGGRERLISNLQFYKRDRFVKGNQLLEQVKVRMGDFSKPYLGLEKKKYTKLAKSVDFVIHNGANVNFLKHYDQLRSDNPIGTLQMITFCLTHKMKPFIYVSTSGVYDRYGGPENMFKREDGYVSKPENLTMGYCQSKWVAEKICENARTKHQLPVQIFRPGDLVGDSHFGAFNPAHDLVKFFQAVIRMGTYPLDSSLFDLTPVDFVAEAMIEVISRTNYSAKMKKYRHNLIHTYLMRNLDLMRILKNDLGYEELRGISSEEWIEEIKNDGMENPLFSIFPILKKDRFNLPDICYESSVFVLSKSKKKKEEEEEGEGDDGSYSVVLPHPVILLKKMIKRMVENKLIKTSNETILFNQTAVVTGASVGIGKSISEYLARSGVNVIMGARRKDLLDEICRETLKNRRYEFVGDIIGCVCDVTKEDDVAKMVEIARKEFGGIDVLVNNAGVMPTTLMKNVKMNEWKNCVNVNVNGFLHCLGSVVEEFVSKKSGHIVNISSDAGREVWETLVVYSASKFFMEAVSKGLRLELGKHGVRVTSIQPGDVGETEILRFNQSDDEGMKKLETMFAKNMLKCEDIAKAVLFAIKQPKYCAVNEILIEPVQ